MIGNIGQCDTVTRNNIMSVVIMSSANDTLIMIITDDLMTS